MSPALWKEVEALFAGALDLPESERHGWVRAATEGRPDLRDEVESLLQAHASASQFLSSPAIRASAWIGRRLGPYRIGEEIGRGGMGAVFRAEREDQFRKQVAIKIIGSGMIPGSMLRRFVEERQILAGLEHPNIARLLDGGATAEGVPYMVMEYIQGVRITQYCNAQGLGARARLELFQAVCFAVHHAHQHLVVHRDIKPANILVTPEGVPVLLDFGIARMLDPLTAAVTETSGPLQPLTPDYASPEQLCGEPVTTATDVYSLGILLYELLVGKRPYSLANVSLLEAVRIIRQDKPPKAGTADEDLDHIVRKAMRAEPEERYASAREAAEDVARYLQGLPVLARRGSLGYIARKTLARHKIAFASAAAVVVLLGAGVGAVGWEAHIANLERAKAIKRFTELRGLAHAVIFELHDGIAQLPGSTEIRRMLVTRALAYLDSLARDSAGDAGLQAELAEAYLRVGDVQGKWSAPNLGDPQGALASYRKGLDVMQNALAAEPRHRDLLTQAAWLNLRIGEIYIGKLDAPQARKYMRQGLDLMVVAPHSQSEMAGALLDTFIATRMTDPAGARPYLDQAVHAYESALLESSKDPERRRNVAMASRYLATVSDSASAIRHLRRSLELDEGRSQADPLNTGARLDMSYDLLEIGHLLMNGYQFNNALGYYRRALSERQVLATADPKNALAQTRLGFAQLAVARALMANGETAAAVESARASTAILTRATASNPADKQAPHYLAEDYTLTGEGEGRLGRWKQACPAFQQAARLHRSLVAVRILDAFQTKLKGRIDAGLAHCGEQASRQTR